MTGAEHPLIAANGAHRPAHLVGKRLEAQAVVRLGERAGECVRGTAALLGDEKELDRLLESTAQEVYIAVEGNPTRPGHATHAERGGKRETVDRVQEEERAHALVQVVAGAAEALETGGFGEQMGRGGAGAEGGGE